MHSLFFWLLHQRYILDQTIFSGILPFILPRRTVQSFRAVILDWYTLDRFPSLNHALNSLVNFVLIAFLFIHSFLLGIIMYIIKCLRPYGYETAHLELRSFLVPLLSLKQTNKQTKSLIQGKIRAECPHPPPCLNHPLTL